MIEDGNHLAVAMDSLEPRIATAQERARKMFEKFKGLATINVTFGAHLAMELTLTLTFERTRTLSENVGA